MSNDALMAQYADPNRPASLQGMSATPRRVDGTGAAMSSTQTEALQIAYAALDKASKWLQGSAVVWMACE